MLSSFISAHSEAALCLFAAFQVAFGAFCTLAGVALGGLLVYRTKREAPLFGTHKPDADIASIEDDFEPDHRGRPWPRFDPSAPPPGAEPAEEPTVDSVIMLQNAKLREQMNAEDARS
jgi:hypothetical protein